LPPPGGILAVDQTGVGRPVIDLLEEGLVGRVDCPLYRLVTLTAGLAPAIDEAGRCLLLPKKELVGTLQVLLRARRRQLVRSMPDFATLVQELENFRLKAQQLGAEAQEAWRERPHDDLVLAVAVAAWEGENLRQFSIA